MKRFNDDYLQNTTNKKTKTDDLWGDDPDVDELEDCIIQATQQTFRAPSYTSFRHNDFYSSTQTNDVVTFETEPAKIDELREKIKELQMNYEAKVGEVNILRTQLKETKASAENEAQLKEKEVVERLGVLKKEVTAAVIKLDLKELENVNLKSKIRDVTARRPIPAADDKVKEIRLSPVDTREHPLKNLVSSDLFFKDGRKKHYVKRLESNGVLRNGEVCLSQIHPEILNLIKMNANDLNNDVNNVNKVLGLTLKSLKELTEFLEEFERNSKKEMISKMDLAYIKNEIVCDGAGNISFFDSRPWCVNECDIHLRQLIALIGEITPYNKRLYGYVSGTNVLTVDTDEVTQKFINENTFLGIILTIVKKIGRTRKSFYYCGLLSSICLLLKRVSVNAELLYEIIFSRPSTLVIHHFTDLLQTVSATDDLCKYPSNGCLRKNNKKGIVYINKGCCILQVYCLMFENYLKDDDKNRLETYEKYSNYIQFICNAFNSNGKFTYHQGNQHDDCLLSLNRLFLNITYVILEQMNVQTNEKIKKRIKHIIKTAVKLMVNFKSLEFIEREVEIDVLCKTVKCKLVAACKTMDIKTHDVSELEKLLPTQDDGSTSTDQLNSLQLWTDGC